jgi:hypothetical protein
MSFQVPFEARGVQDFPVYPIEEGIEYTVVDISDDGSRFAVQAADGSLGWFPTKYVRILETRSPQQAQQRTNYHQNTSSQAYTPSPNAYSKEHDAAKKQAAEKERRRLELQKKLKQSPKKADNDIDDEEINNASRQLQQMKTYTEARGYLSNAPGFNRDLTQYIEDENQPEPEPVSIKTSSKTNTTTTSTTVFRKVEERSDGPKYVPSEELPPQYKTGPWKCHSCCTNNGADRQKCNMCGTLRGEMSISLDDVSNTPTAEWNCPACKVLNPPTRITCVLCGSKYKPIVSPGKSDTKKDPHKDPKKTAAGGVKKKTIVTKAGSGVELQYAKGVDNYKNGGFIPGHGAGY